MQVISLLFYSETNCPPRHKKKLEALAQIIELSVQQTRRINEEFRNRIKPNIKNNYVGRTMYIACFEGNNKIPCRSDVP